MCGIAGFYQTNFNFTKSPQWKLRLNKMGAALGNRGPDDSGLALYPHAGLAHTRLSIIDLEGGHQPITKWEHKKGCSIIYNGELYNTAELRELLSYYHLNWKTKSDTEVILNGFLAMGTRFFSQLNGIYAFAIYHQEDDILYLVRDRLGVKPLFYQQTKEVFLFGSEPKAIFAYGISPQLNSESYLEVLGLGPARTPGHGVYKDMKEVLPGHFLMIKDSTVCNSYYWKLTALPHRDSYEDTIDKVNFLVTDSITRQMISDIPICTFLSGGLDSSIISAICQKELLRRGKELSTYSFDFVNNDKNFQANSFQVSRDRPFVEIMVDHIHSNHTYLECDNLAQLNYLYKAVDARDLPCMADVESSLLYFCELVSKQHRVALTGECADEIFGGYPWFHRQELMNQNLFPWSYDLSPRLSLLNEDFLKDHDIAGYVQNAYEESLKTTPLLEGETGLVKRQREIAWLNIQWFMATLLNRMDRTSMYSGLEARVPFADHRILQYVYNIPWSIKCHNGQTKSLLIDAFQDLLPKEILYRKKSPYPKTYDPLYEGLLKQQLTEILTDSTAPLHAVIDKRKVLTFMNSPSDYNKPWYGQLMAGPQMMAYLLQVNHWLKSSGASC